VRFCLSACRRIEAQEKALQQEAIALQEKVEAEKRKAEAEKEQKEQQQLKMEAEQREQQQMEAEQREQQQQREKQAKEISVDTFSPTGVSAKPMLITQSPKLSTFKVTISQRKNQQN
jgi:hypothetical protein